MNTTISIRRSDDDADPVLLINEVEVAGGARVTLNARTLAALVYGYAKAAATGGARAGIAAGIVEGAELTASTRRIRKTVIRDEQGVITEIIEEPAPDVTTVP